MNRKTLVVLFLFAFIFIDINIRQSNKVNAIDLTNATLNAYALSGTLSMIKSDNVSPDDEQSATENCDGSGWISHDGGTSKVKCPGCDNCSGTETVVAENSDVCVCHITGECDCGDSCECPNCTCVTCKEPDKKVSAKKVDESLIDLDLNNPAEKAVHDVISKGLSNRVIMLSDSKSCRPCILSKHAIIDTHMAQQKYKDLGWKYGFGVDAVANHLQVIDWADADHREFHEQLRTTVKNHWSNYGEKIPTWVRIKDNKIDSWYVGQIDWAQFNNYIRLGKNPGNK